MLSLESQIHWLTEQNNQLVESARNLPEGGGGLPAGVAAAAGVDAAGEVSTTARCFGLESDLRKSRRAEQKLQALLYRWADVCTR